LRADTERIQTSVALTIGIAMGAMAATKCLLGFSGDAKTEKKPFPRRKNFCLLTARAYRG
jgi:hypothetical protein